LDPCIQFLARFIGHIINRLGVVEGAIGDFTNMVTGNEVRTDLDLLAVAGFVPNILVWDSITFPILYKNTRQSLFNILHTLAGIIVKSVLISSLEDKCPREA
jgi:hypothetical protein